MNQLQKLKTQLFFIKTGNKEKKNTPSKHENSWHTIKTKSKKT